MTSLLVVLTVAATALGWLSWTLLRRRYPRRRLVGIVAAGWAAGLLCMLAIVRSDNASEERQADAFCAMIQTRGGVQTTAGDAADACKTAYVRCRRALRSQPGYSELTYDAERERMNSCLGRSISPPR